MTGRHAADAASIFRDSLHAVRAGTDRLFALLMVIQWVGATAVAAVLTPRTWSGAQWTIHPHVTAAAVVGAALALPVVALALRWPGHLITRHAIAVAQMLFSGMLIHLTGGRIETHFHVFGSLAFLAFYRDWKVLIPATIVVAVDHGLRGMYWPQSVFGESVASPWRGLEHAAWVLFTDVFLAVSCLRAVREMRRAAATQADLLTAIRQTETLIGQRTEDLEQARQEIHADRDLLLNIINNLPYVIFWKDRESRYLGCNNAMARIAGAAGPSALIGKCDYDMPWTREQSDAYREDDRQVMASAAPKLNIEEHLRQPDGQVRTLLTSKVPLRGGDGEIIGVLGIFADITDRKMLEAQLAQAQRLESIGQLAAGIAHEINTPIQYVSDNTRFLKEQFAAVMSILDRHQRLLTAGPLDWSERRREVEDAAREVDFDFLRAEVPLALDQSLEGLERVATIVRAMKDFSHPGSAAKTPADLNAAIASTVTVCTNRWKYHAEMELRLDPALPPVPCLLAEFNQVVLNLIVNAADAIAESRRDAGGRGRITITTRRSGPSVEVLVADDGAGIPEDARPRIFSPFFTTKPVGKGTGQGLAISRDVIVNKHGGALRFETITGRGTTFIISLPLGDAADQPLKEAA